MHLALIFHLGAILAEGMDEAKGDEPDGPKHMSLLRDLMGGIVVAFISSHYSRVVAFISSRNKKNMFIRRSCVTHLHAQYLSRFPFPRTYRFMLSRVKGPLGSMLVPFGRHLEFKSGDFAWEVFQK